MALLSATANQDALFFQYYYPWIQLMTNRAKIWVIDDDRSIRWVLEKALCQADMDVTTFESATGIQEMLQTDQHPDVLITDIRMPGMDGFQLLDVINNSYRSRSN